MSKLSDKIRRSSRIEPQPMGFVTSRATSDATMVLVGRVRDARGASEMAQRGADAVILGSADRPASASDRRDAGEMIVGGWIDGKAEQGAKSLKEGGFDFVVFDPDKTASTAVLEEDIGYVMAVPGNATDTELRTIEGFGLDAVDVGMLDGPMTVRRQMDLRRIFALTRKPLMASVPAQISQAELQALRDTNVVVVCVDSADAVAKLRSVIDALPARSKRRDEPDRPIAMVPRATGGDHEHDDDDDDD